MLLRVTIVALALSFAPRVLAQDAPDAEAEPERHDPVGPIVMMAAGGLVIVTGLTLFLLGSADRDAVEGAEVGTRWEDVAGRAERGPIFLGVGQIAMGAGIIVVGVGLTWLILTLADVDPDPFGTAELDVDVGPTGLRLRGRF